MTKEVTEAHIRGERAVVWGLYALPTFKFNVLANKTDHGWDPAQGPPRDHPCPDSFWFYIWDPDNEICPIMPIYMVYLISQNLKIVSMSARFTISRETGSSFSTFSDSRTCARTNCQYGCEDTDEGPRCLCPSSGLHLASNGRVCLGRTSGIASTSTPYPSASWAHFFIHHNQLIDLTLQAPKSTDICPFLKWSF